MRELHVINVVLLMYVIVLINVIINIRAIISNFHLNISRLFIRIWFKIVSDSFK